MKLLRTFGLVMLIVLVSSSPGLAEPTFSCAEVTDVPPFDRDVNTVWVTEHLLKDVDDLRAVLSLPAPEPGAPQGGRLASGASPPPHRTR